MNGRGLGDMISPVLGAAACAFALGLTVFLFGTALNVAVGSDALEMITRIGTAIVVVASFAAFWWEMR